MKVPSSPLEIYQFHRQPLYLQIAHTIKDCPLLKSPAAKTFLSEV